MAHRVTTIPNRRATPGKAPVPQSSGDGLADAQGRQRSDFTESVWALMCSVRFAVVLNLALALSAMLGTFIPQMPAGIQNFDQELKLFLDNAQSRYGDLSGFLHWAGFYDLYYSLWFRLLVVTVVFSIVMCTLNRWQPIMRQIRTPALRFADNFIGGLSEKAEFRSVPVDAGTAESALRGALRKGRYRTVAQASEDGRTLYVYADRDRWSKLVTFVSHGALVMLILVWAGLANFGWREQSVYFYPGQAVNIGHDTQFSVRNDKFWIEYYPDGKTIKEYRHTLAVVENGQDVLTKTIVVNDPLRYQDINFFLVSYQPVVFVKAQDAAGKELEARKMTASGPITATTGTAGALVEFNQTSGDNLPLDIVQYPVGDHFLTLMMTYYQDVARLDSENPPVYVQAFVDKNFEAPIYEGFLPRTGSLQLPGYEQINFAFTRDTATILEVAKDPGLGLVGFFFAVMTLGFTLSLYTSFSRCWARIGVDETRPGTVNLLVGGMAEKNKVSFERDFERLAIRIKENLAKAAREAAKARPGDAPTPAAEAVEV
jgi:cytochrome c biogenesis protein